MDNQIQTHTVKPEVSSIINGTTVRFISTESEVNLDNKLKAIEDYMASNNARGKSEEEKNKAYGEAQKFHKEYLHEFLDTKYNFYLNRVQYNFLTDLLLSKLEYDVNTVFIAIELSNLLGSMKNTGKYTNDKEVISYEINATELTYIYHLIAKHTVKGLSKQAYTFAEILSKIGELSKIFNYYETANKNSVDDISHWVYSFDESIQIEGQTLEPTETSEKKSKSKKKEAAE
jgi:hypothetical protein